MSARRVALPALAASALAGGVRLFQQYAPVAFADAGVLPLWSVLSLAASLIVLVLNPGVVLAAGYWVGRRVPVPDAWPAVAAWTFAGSAVGYVLAGVAGGALLVVLTDVRGFLGSVAISALFNGLSGSLSAAVAGVAGASVGYFSR